MRKTTSLIDTILAGRTIDQVLKDDARTIKAIGEHIGEKSYEAKNEYGYATAKILPVSKKNETL